jgi:hypothetical protein
MISFSADASHRIVARRLTHTRVACTPTPLILEILD